ncbi:MAG: hypothetical protein DRO00_05840 [Thermoproteota archaeon]|nr:MAG: hypothetical protein DRO00_05840 [Candidatus Korarchaeota archaeon]
MFFRKRPYFGIDLYFNDLISIITDPEGFFRRVRLHNWRKPFYFFLQTTLLLSIGTIALNLYGYGSTDLSSAYQSQIIAYRMTTRYLLPKFGNFAFVIEFFLIIFFSIVLLTILTLVFHIIFLILGGKGSIVDAWKAMCYGTGPCALGGFIPYLSLVVGFYSFFLQFYIAPRSLYRLKESRLLLLLSLLFAGLFIEIYMYGTTVGYP